MSIQQLLEFSGAITLISPATLLLILGLVPLLGIRLNESITSFVTQVSVIIGLFGAGVYIVQSLLEARE